MEFLSVQRLDLENIHQTTLNYLSDGEAGTAKLSRRISGEASISSSPDEDDISQIKNRFN